MKKILFAFTLLTFSLVQAQAADNYEDNFEKYDEVNDPIEPLNRSIQQFNDVIDGLIYKPISRGYKTAVPEWGRKRVSNAMYNLSEPVTVANSVLQGDAENAFTSFWRFVINSSFGVLGTFEAAAEVGLKPRQEDFGQTLASWGWQDSSYIVLPLLGPSTLRDTVGMGVDFFSDPFTNKHVVGEDGRIAIIVTRAIDLRSRLLESTDEIDRSSLDTYASYRSAYLQRRKNDIYNGLPPIY